jgi:hypothetical protein
MPLRGRRRQINSWQQGRRPGRQADRTHSPSGAVRCHRGGRPSVAAGRADGRRACALHRASTPPGAEPASSSAPRSRANRSSVSRLPCREPSGEGSRESDGQAERPSEPGGEGVKEQRAPSLVLGRGSNVLATRQIGEKCADLLLAHLARGATSGEWCSWGATT